MVSTAEAAAIDAWRYTNRIPSRAEAIRLLIERGLQDDALPAEASPPTAGEAPTSGAPDLSNARPYPADEIAACADLIKQMNVDLPAKLKIQLKWLADVRRKSQTQQVVGMLQKGVETELKQLGIKPRLALTAATSRKSSAAAP